MAPQVDMPELLRRLKEKSALDNAAIARLTGASRSVISRAVHSNRNAGKVWATGVAVFELAQKLGIEIPRR